MFSCSSAFPVQNYVEIFQNFENGCTILWNVCIVSTGSSCCVAARTQAGDRGGASSGIFNTKWLTEGVDCTAHHPRCRLWLHWKSAAACPSNKYVWLSRWVSTIFLLITYFWRDNFHQHYSFQSSSLWTVNRRMRFCFGFWQQAMIIFIFCLQMFHYCIKLENFSFFSVCWYHLEQKSSDNKYNKVQVQQRKKGAWIKFVTTSGLCYNSHSSCTA